MKFKALLSATNIIILCAALVCINFIASKLHCKIDFTQNSLYTLSEGSKHIAARVEDDAVIQYFFSQSAENLPVMLKDYGRRVQELLQEFADLSPRLHLEVYDPRPDSDEEEMATRFGIRGAQTGDGTQFYMGAAIQYQDKTYQIPFFDPRKEMFLEYDIASLLARLKETGEKKVLGVLSGVQLSSPQLPPSLQMQSTREDWLFVRELERVFEKRELEATVEEIPDDIDLLLVVHPKNVSEKTEYAIEQFILNGGNAAIIVDPSAKTDPDPNNKMAQYGMMVGTSSNLPKVFATLGLQYDPLLVAADPQHSTRINSASGPLQYPYWLSLDDASFNRDEVVTAQLNSMLLVEAGFIKPRQDAPFRFTPLISTAAPAGTISASRLSFVSGQNTDSYDRVDGPLALAGIVSGAFVSSFSDKPAESKYTKPHLAQAAAENSVLVIADLDFLNNSYCLRKLNFLGQTIIQPVNQNIAFLTNALEFMTGSTELISIRSRGSFQRPFERVEAIEKQAQAKWFSVEKELTDKIQDLQQKLNTLQRAKKQDNQLLLSQEQQDEIKKFKIEQLEFKRKRREVRKNLRQDIERLGTVLTLVNMTVVPALVLLAGLYIYFRRINGKTLFGAGR